MLNVFAPAQAVADAVLYEGYVLYPYRASADKNRIRWQWGVVGPRGAADDGVGEPSTMATDLALERWGRTTIGLRLRFLRVVERRVEQTTSTGAVRVESVAIGDETHVSFDDAEEQVVETSLTVGDGPVESCVEFTLDAHTECDELGSTGDGTYRLVRHREEITGRLEVGAEPAGSATDLVRVAIQNTTGWTGGSRDDANLRSLVGTHVLGAIDQGLFLSVVDPPDEHREVVTRCESHRLWPVVIGAPQRASLVLASPVILGDQPEIAPESAATFYDGLEIDEMLTLRVMTMTDEEKAEARATDPRSAAIVDRVEAMSADEMASLHGAIRDPNGSAPGIDAEDLTGGQPWWDPGVDERFDPDTDGVVVAGTPISRGSVVQLHPGKRADAHDLFYRDRVATVAAIIHDVDGSIHVAVTLDDDPAADLNDATGRYLYFSPDEVEPLGRRVDR